MSSHSFSFWIGVAGLVASLAGLIVACVIYHKQNGQIVELGNIGTVTRQNVELLNREQHRHEMVRDFFHAGKNEPTAFGCFAPAARGGSPRKPLPVINAGDYYALHVIQSLLLGDKLDISLQIPNEPQRRYEGGNAIFLCSPQANPALDDKAPRLSIVGAERCTECKVFGDIEIPCWFADHWPEGALDSVKKIWTRDHEAPLESGAEGAYRRAATGNYTPQAGVRDYAVVLRLTLPGDRRVFVVAGIHQYGTWIAGEFLHVLSRKYDSDRNRSISEDERSILLQGHADIAAVVTGKVDEITLVARKPAIFEDCLWFRKGGAWHQIGDARWKQNLSELCRGEQRNPAGQFSEAVR